MFSYKQRYTHDFIGRWEHNPPNPPHVFYEDIFTRLNWCLNSLFSIWTRRHSINTGRKREAVELEDDEN